MNQEGHDLLVSTGAEFSPIVGVEFSLVDGFGECSVISRFRDRRHPFLVGGRGVLAPAGRL